MPKLKAFEVEKYSKQDNYTKSKPKTKIRDFNNNFNSYKKNDKSRRPGNYK